jgi:glycine hydroxymethyltransferase
MATTTREEGFEVHDAQVLSKTRAFLDECRSFKEMAQAVEDAVHRNEEWRGKRCINLLAPEAPTSPKVRNLLAAEIGTRAAEGHIGRVNRWFAGTGHIDEVEALCVELLKRVFKCKYADHRLMGSMLGNMATYWALTEPGDVIMSAAQPVGGHSSNRWDGPAGFRGLKIVDIPFDPVELEVDMDLFRKAAPLVKPKVVGLGMSMTLFPYPVRSMVEIISEWGGRLFFDGAHQLGLIGAGFFEDPLAEGAAVLTGSAGKTFAGPQSGIIVWNDPNLTQPITSAIFPGLAATHQVNRVAALAYSAAEMLQFGQAFMEQIVANAQALGAALTERGLSILCSHKGYTKTHQVIADASSFGGGIAAAQALERANIITNKNLIPKDKPENWDRPSGLRIGTIEVTRLGMGAKEMKTIANFAARVLVEKENPETVAKDVMDFRSGYQTIYYCFENGLPR